MKRDNELLEINSGLDQPIQVDLKFLDQIDTLADKAVQEEDITILVNAAKNMLGIARISGISLAKLLWKIEKNWNRFNMDSNDTCQDFLSAELGLSSITVSRYIKVWNLLSSQIIPKELVEKIESRPMRDLVSISSCVSQDFELTDDDWQKIANAPDSATINEELRRIKNVEPRSSALLLRLRRNGDITAYKDGAQFFVGYLSVDEENEVVLAAIDRIISGSGILKE